MGILGVCIANEQGRTQILPYRGHLHHSMTSPTDSHTTPSYHSPPLEGPPPSTRGHQPFKNAQRDLFISPRSRLHPLESQQAAHSLRPEQKGAAAFRQQREIQGSRQGASLWQRSLREEGRYGGSGSDARQRRGFSAVGRDRGRSLRRGLHERERGSSSSPDARQRRTLSRQRERSLRGDLQSQASPGSKEKPTSDPPQQHGETLKSPSTAQHLDQTSARQNFCGGFGGGATGKARGGVPYRAGHEGFAAEVPYPEERGQRWREEKSSGWGQGEDDVGSMQQPGQPRTGVLLPSRTSLNWPCIPCM